MAIKERDIKMISHFRNNARQSLTNLSKMTKIPVSTIFDKLKEYEENSLIKKHTSLLDFKKLGYDIRTQILLTAGTEGREKLQKFLMMHPRVNTIYRINNGFDFLIEGIFRNMTELDSFGAELDAQKPLDKKEFFIMEEMKREEFLSYKENLGIQR